MLAQSFFRGITHLDSSILTEYFCMPWRCWISKSIIMQPWCEVKKGECVQRSLKTLQNPYGFIHKGIEKKIHSPLLCVLSALHSKQAPHTTSQKKKHSNNSSKSYLNSFLHNTVFTEECDYYTYSIDKENRQKYTVMRQQVSWNLGFIRIFKYEDQSEIKFAWRVSPRVKNRNRLWFYQRKSLLRGSRLFLKPKHNHGGHSLKGEL